MCGSIRLPVLGICCGAWSSTEWGVGWAIIRVDQQYLETVSRRFRVQVPLAYELCDPGRRCSSNEAECSRYIFCTTLRYRNYINSIYILPPSAPTSSVLRHLAHRGCKRSPTISHQQKRESYLNQWTANWGTGAEYWRNRLGE